MSCQTYSKREWEEKRDIITRLYRPPARQKEVLEVLSKQYKFYPSSQMLKKRIRKWGIEKNNKEADIAFAIKLLVDREGLGRESQVIIRKNLVTLQEIQRYLGRKRIRNARDWAANTANTDPRPWVIANTPPRSPCISHPPTPSLLGVSASVSAIESGNQHHENGQSTLSMSHNRRWSYGEAACTALSNPFKLDFLEQALRYNADYYDSLFASPTYHLSWSLNAEVLPDLPEAESLKPFTNGMWRGRDFLLEGRSQNAFACFDRAFEMISGILQDESRKFLPELYEMILNFQLGDNQNILEVLLRFLVSMGSVRKPGSCHPAEIALRLLQMDIVERYYSVERLLQSVSHRFQAQLGPEHRETLSVNKALARSVFRRQRLPNAIDFLRTVLVQNQGTYVLNPYEHCGVLIELAQCHKFQNQFDEAIFWTEEAWKTANLLQSPFHQADVQVRCLRTFAWVEAKHWRLESACSFARQAAEISTGALGAEDSLTALVNAELVELEMEFWKSGAQSVNERRVT